jgi:hypothetical protein
MIEFLTKGKNQDGAREIIEILIDSDLYLDMDLEERLGLIRYLAAYYEHCSPR